MKLSMMVVLSIDVPDGYGCSLTNEPEDGGGFKYTAHLRQWGQETISSEITDLTHLCQYAITSRLRDAVAKHSEEPAV